MCCIWWLILSANNQAEILIAFEKGIKDDIVLDHQKQFNLFLKAGIKVAALFTKTGKAKGHSQLCRWVRRKSAQIGITECYSSTEPLKSSIQFRGSDVHSLTPKESGELFCSVTWAVFGTNCFVEDCFPGALVDCAQAPGLMPFSAQGHGHPTASGVFSQ